MKLKMFCATDETYVEMTHVMLRSLVVNSRKSLSRIDVFGWRLSDRNAEALSGVAPDLVVVHRLRDLPPALEPIRFRIVEMVPTWLRLVAPDLIPVSDENLLYIDCDCIVDRDIGELAALDMGANLFAAVRDCSVAKHPMWLERLRLPPETPYFNAGVMVFNHRLYRSGEWSRKAVDLTLADPVRVAMNDQDVFNLLVAGDWLHLPASFNAHLPSSVTRLAEGGDQFDGAHIIHFVGRYKPTDDDCHHAARDVYLRYRRDTVYAGRPLRNGYLREAVKHLRRGLGRMKRFGVRLGLRVV